MTSAQNQLIECETAEQCRQIAEIQKEAIPVLLFITVAVIAIAYVVVILKRYPPVKSDE